MALSPDSQPTMDMDGQSLLCIFGLSISSSLFSFLVCCFASNNRIFLRTGREQHDSHRLIAATPGAEAQGDQRHEEGEQGEGCPP